MSRKNRRYGWKPQLPDIRDWAYAAPAPPVGGLPSSVDLRQFCPPVYDQGQIGSCSACAIGGAFEFDQLKQKLPAWTPSKLFIYFNERDMEGTVAQDAGAQIRDGIKSVASQGVCSEDLWPYDDGPVTFTQKPPQSCYDSARTNLVTSYKALAQSIDQVRGCLSSGFPVIFGFTAYEHFESDALAQSGNLAMPDASKEKVVGGHAVLAVGYEDSMQITSPTTGLVTQGAVLVRNSWGADWGLDGYFWMPYDYMMHADLAGDLWTIRWVTSASA